MRKYIVVSGFRRSGTSAMMSALRWCGIPIIGYKYPISMKVRNGMSIDAGIDIPIVQESAMRNPTGFWEVGNITRNALTDASVTGYDGLCVKVVLDALFRSDPCIIDKVVMMVRHPRHVVDSYIKVEPKYNTADDVVGIIMSLIENFITVMKWMRNKNVMFKLVIFEEMLEDPVKILSDICDWVGRGEGKYATEIIKKRHVTAHGVEGSWKIMDEAEKIYQMCVDRHISGLLNYDVSHIQEKLNEKYLVSVGEANKKEG